MSDGETVLVVEDDRSTRMAVVENLRFEGYNVIYAADGEEGLRMAVDRRPDLVILDVMLPRLNGYEICETLRKHGLMMPVLMLTAKGQEYDRVLGLDIGADDYITKPFSVRELMARVKASLRREKRLKSTDEPVEFGDCRLDFDKRALFKGGQEVPVTKTEFELLKHFVTHPGRVFSARPSSTPSGDTTITVPTAPWTASSPSCARRSRTTRPTRPHILTVHGAGYRFEK